MAVIPGMKSGLKFIGESGPGLDEMFADLHASLKQDRVALIRGCFFNKLGICVGFNHGVA